MYLLNVQLYISSQNFFCNIVLLLTLIIGIFTQTKWRMHSNDKISEIISHFSSVQSNSVAIEGSCQSMVYRSVTLDGDTYRRNLPTITKWNLQILTMCTLRMLGKILFVIVLPISGSCQSMVYRSVQITM